MEGLLQYLKDEKILIPHEQEEETITIPSVLCHLSNEVPYQQVGYAYGTLSRQSTKLIFEIEDNPSYNRIVQRRNGVIEIEDVATVEVTKLSALMPLVNIIAVKRHMHPPIYFRYFTHLAYVPFFGNGNDMNQQIFAMCEKCITNVDENEYCKNEKIKISNIKTRCIELGKEPEFAEIDKKEYDSLFLCYSILAKLQPEDNLELFTLLIDNGLNIKKLIPGWVNETTFSTTLMNFAVKRKLQSVVVYLLDKGADINEKSMGQTPIHIACSTKNLALCRLLFNNNADIHSSNDFGETPLSISISQEDFDTVRFLLESGATITPDNLSSASKMGNLAIIQVLVDKFLTYVDYDIIEILTNLLEQCDNSDIKDYLISKGANVQKNSCTFQ